MERELGAEAISKEGGLPAARVPQRRQLHDPDSAQASRKRLATQLAFLVATAGLIPIALVGTFSLRTLRVRARADAQDTLQAVAQQAAERIHTYQNQQREMLRAIAANMGTDPLAERRLEEVTLDAPSFNHLVLLDRQSPP